jgi:putative sigma-54 modulation protein
MSIGTHILSHRPIATWLHKIKEKGLDIMRIIISGRNIELTDGLKAAVEDKIGKLEKYFTPDTDVYVTLSVEKERQKIEVTIPVKGNIIRSEQVSNDMYVSIDLVEEIIERQLKKYKNKLIAQKQSASSFRKEFIEKEVEADDEIKIIRTKKFDMKPMYPEDACVQMELLGHDFFVFVNAESDEVNVVYKRKGSTYGLIEPEF